MRKDNDDLVWIIVLILISGLQDLKISKILKFLLILHGHTFVSLIINDNV